MQPESVGWCRRGQQKRRNGRNRGHAGHLRLSIERRLVPASAVKAEVEERVENTSRSGRERASAKIKKEFKERSHVGPAAPSPAVINDVMDRPGQQVPSLILPASVPTRWSAIDRSVERNSGHAPA
jgi:hypothetical protein